MSKAKVAIVTDSTCNLPDELVEKYGIYVIPQILNWDGKSLLDGIDITTEQFYERLAASDTIPTTSQPSAGEFLEFLKDVAGKAESIVAILISDELSGTLDSARTAASMMEGTPTEIVDSRSASMGLGLIVQAAAEAVEGGASHTEAAEVARALVPHMNVLFVVDTLEYLHKGGRMGGAQRLLGSMLSIKPVLRLLDGRIEVVAKIRTKKKAMHHLLELVQEDTAGKADVYAGVISASDPDDGGVIYDAVQAKVHPVQLTYSDLTPVLGTHVGPGTVGVAYYAGPGA